MGAGTDAVTLERRGQVAVIRVVGRYDLTASERIAVHLSGDGGPLILDLSEVTYLTSTGIGNIVALVAERSTFLAAPSEVVSRSLEIVDLSDHLRIHETLEDALAHAGP